MARDDHAPFREAHNLASADKSFYPVRIPVSHWQLRHYISLPEPDLLYYASAHDIYCLNTATKKRKHIATLPFEARCTASGFGWVCIGGEDEGHFATIKLDTSGSRTSDVDSALPVDHWRHDRRAASIIVERIGEDIVNSVSIHRIHDEDAHLDDIVAVLTNNDKTVRIYSLPQSLETTVLDLPFQMNHATISPNGQTLVAVGDLNQAYFFTRDIQETPPQIPKPHNRLTSASMDWNLTSVVTLHVSPLDNALGYFTTAWSPNGHLVAVGSEGGYITVFDSRVLESADYRDEDAVVAVIPSSRANNATSHAGAVRTMIFSPEPWDLLIWAEDQGRVCIGDLRTALNTKQIIHLEPKEEGLRKVEYEDTIGNDSAMVQSPLRDLDDLEADFIRRYRHAPDNASAVNFASEYIEARRRQRQHHRAEVAARNTRNTRQADDPQGLTAHEEQILESLRTTRQQEEARSNGRATRSINYTASEMFPSIATRSPTSTSDNDPHDPVHFRLLNARIAAASPPNDFPELSRSHAAASPRPTSARADENPNVTLPSLRSFREDAEITTRRSQAHRGDGTRIPQRQQSMIFASSTDENAGAIPATNPEAGEENPWRTIEEHMTLAQGPLFEGAARSSAASPLPAANQPNRNSEAEIEVSLATDRARARSLARQRERWRIRRAEGAASSAAAATTINPYMPSGLTDRRINGFPEGYESLLRRSQLRATSGREIGVKTAGLAMSQDGGTLWCACEEGIFEVRMNLKGRMFYPSIEPR